MSCRACGAVQLADTVDPKLIYTDYLYTTSVSRGLDKHFEAYADEVMARVQPHTGALVVDIGSNDGTLLKAFKCRDCNVFGIEPAHEIATQSGVNVWCEYFSDRVGKDLATQRGRADIITANHIMANVADLHDFIKGVKHLLAPDGTFVFETGYWPAIVERNLIDTIEHEHIHYFAVRPLQKLFRRHGLELVHVEQNAAKGGSLRGYVRHNEPQFDSDTSVLRTIVNENRMAPLDTWVRDLKDLEQRMKAIIDASPNETWVGYGAAVGSTLLLHQFGLGEKLMCLVDANPAKQGRIAPFEGTTNHRLMVYSPDRLRSLCPDRIVILAWRYADMIQQQHPGFAGKWLLPLPELVTK